MCPSRRTTAAMRRGGTDGVPAILIIMFDEHNPIMGVMMWFDTIPC